MSVRTNAEFDFAARLSLTAGLASYCDQTMRNQLGFLLQFAALVFLPLLIIWQLNFGFRLLWMPVLSIAGLLLFYVGHWLRERAP